MKLWIDAIGSADSSLGLKAMELNLGLPLCISFFLCKVAIDYADFWMEGTCEFSSSKSYNLNYCPVLLILMGVIFFSTEEVVNFYILGMQGLNYSDSSCEFWTLLYASVKLRAYQNGFVHLE